MTFKKAISLLSGPLTNLFDLHSILMKKEFHKVTLLNIQVDNFTMDEFLSHLEEGFVVTPNVDHLMKLQKDKAFYDIYAKATFKVLDSRVIYYLLKLTNSPVKGVIPGSELLPAFYSFHKNNPNIRIFLLGGMNGTAEKAKENINKKVKRDIVTGAYSPSYGFEQKPEENNQIIKMINNSRANVLMVGVGAPKQEKWLSKHLPYLDNIKIAMAIGASIDFEAGFRRRSPRWLQKIGMEWFYRFLLEPRRLWKRYFIDDLPFLLLFFKQKTGLYKNPFESSGNFKQNDT
jgi:exopolysaccharide biosynthesis WecB/TagA/CpsF family protein